MKEKLPNFENNRSEEVEFHVERNKDKVESHSKSTEKQKTYSEEDLDKLRLKAEKEALPSADLLPDKSPAETPSTYRRHKKQSPNSTLKQAQSRLSPSERKFSQVIHNPTIETVSDIAGGSIARPSGLLWGGIFSFFGSLTVLFVCRYFGYEYSYFIALAGFAGGFITGIIIESLWKLLTVKISRS